MPLTKMRTLHQLLPALLLILSNNISISWAQQSAAGQDTLIGIVGRDFVMMGADSSSSGGGGIALTSCTMDKISVIHDGRGVLNGDIDGSNRMVGRDYDSSQESLEQQAIAVGFAGDAADADRLMGNLKTHAQVREYEAGIGNDVLCVFDGRIDDSSTTTTNMLGGGTFSPAALDADAIANLARNEISSRMRSRQPLQLCLLVGGMVRCNNPDTIALTDDIEVVVDRVQKQISAGSATYRSNSNGEKNDRANNRKTTNRSGDSSEQTSDKNEQPKPTNPFLAPQLFWLDQYGSLQNMRYAAHGHGSNFAYSVLDQRYRSAMSRQEAVDLIRECFEQLSERYVINSPRPPRIKCIDQFGVMEIVEDEIK